MITLKLKLKRFIAALAIATLLCAANASSQQRARASKRETSNANSIAMTTDLVWPLPPEKPRYKYLGSISNSADIEPPKKKGWLSKLINEEQTRDVLGMTRPAGIAMDSQGRIYVADTLKAVVFIFDLKRKQMNLLGNDGRGRLAAPLGIAIDSADNVYVSDTRLNRVHVYDRTGKLTAALKQIGSETIVNPAGLAIDAERNRLLIVDSQGHRVFRVNLSRLNEGSSYGKRGEGDSEFQYPSFVAVGKDGRIIVSDTLNFCVKIFDADFKFIRKIGQHGTALGMFDRPKGIALDSQGNIYVVDTSFSNFQVFSSEGQLLLFVGSFGEEPGSFRLPTGIFIDDKDKIYVADGINRRLQMFQFLAENK